MTATEKDVGLEQFSEFIECFTSKTGEVISELNEIINKTIDLEVGIFNK